MRCSDGAFIQAYNCQRAVDREKHMIVAAGVVQAPTGRILKGLTQKERMRRRLKTKKGRAEHDKRKVAVEPVCGQLRTVSGTRS